MSRSILALPPEQLTPFDLDAFIAHAETLNQQNRETFIAPFPKASNRWLSHYEFTPHPIALTSQGEVDGGLSWLVGVPLDFSFTRSLCAPSYGTRGGSGYDPASLVFLEVAGKVDQYTDDAQFCRDLHDSDKRRRYRLLAGLHGAVPGEDDLAQHVRLEAFRKSPARARKTRSHPKRLSKKGHVSTAKLLKSRKAQATAP
jgi:hypothetical protein